MASKKGIKSTAAQAKKRRLVRPDRTVGHGVARRNKGANRHDELIDMALMLFAERHFDSVTIKDIAEKIGINPALLYYYFKSKDELLNAALDHAIVVSFSNYRLHVYNKADPITSLSEWFDNHLLSNVPIRQMVKIMLDYVSANPEQTAIATSIQRFYGEESRLLTAAVRDGIASGVFRKVDPREAAQIASTMLDGLIVRALILRGYDTARGIKSLKEVFFRYLGVEQEAPKPSAQTIRKRK